MDKKRLILGGIIGGIAITAAITGAVLFFPKQSTEDIEHNLLKDYVFYKGKATVYENQSWKSKGTDGSSGIGDATLTSEEVLVYDQATDKCYIVGRCLNYNSGHTITVNDMHGKYLNTGNVSAKGELIEYYGNGILQKSEKDNTEASINPQYTFNFNSNPIRMDNQKKLVFTIPPTKKSDWVIYVSTAETTRTGGPRVLPPEEINNDILNLVPEVSNISDSKSYNSNETYVYEATTRFWTPTGNFSYEYTKMTYDQIKEELDKLQEAAEHKEIFKNMVKDYPSVWSETADLADSMDIIRNESQTITDIIKTAIPTNYKENKNLGDSIYTISNDRRLKEALKKELEEIQMQQGILSKLNDTVLKTSSQSNVGNEQKKLKQTFDALLPSLKDFFSEYKLRYDEIQKSISQISTIDTKNNELSKEKAITLFDNCLIQVNAIEQLNMYQNIMLSDIYVILTDLNNGVNVDDEKKYSELNRLYGLWEQTLKEFKTGKRIDVNVEKGIELPAEYPKNIIPIIDGAKIVISEKLEDQNGYTVSFKTNLTQGDVLQYYKNILKDVPDVNIFNVSGIETLSGQKDGYEFSLMIMQNNLGGNEKTAVQITLSEIR